MGSGFKNFTSTVLTAADLNNFCQSQSIMYFSSTGARDVAITAPAAGMTAYIDSADSSEGLYSYTGIRWNRGPSWNAPWGVVSNVQTTTTQGSITTRVAVTSMTTGSITYVANRLLRVTVQTPKMATTLADSRIEVFLMNGATTVSSCTSISPTAFSGQTTGLSFFETTTAGARTYSLEIGRNDASTVTTNASATNPFQLIVEDIGPSGAPA